VTALAVTGLHHAIQDPWPVWVALGTGAVVIAEAYWHPRQTPDSLRLVLGADAAGLGVW
jgi:hypothetical protein